MTEKLYKIMLSCWNYNAKIRPSFIILKNQLKMAFEEDVYQRPRATRTTSIAGLSESTTANYYCILRCEVQKNDLTLDI